MRQKQDPWHKPRGPANHFTDAEVELIRAAHLAKRAPKDIAEELKCSQRSINRYYAMIREGRDFLCRRPVKIVPVVETKRAAVDRHYHGNFEL